MLKKFLTGTFLIIPGFAFSSLADLAKAPSDPVAMKHTQELHKIILDPRVVGPFSNHLFKSMTEKEMAEFVEKAKKVLPLSFTQRKFYHGNILDIFVKLPSKERAEFTTQVSRLVSSESSPEFRFGVVKALFKVPADQRKSIVDATLKFVGKTTRKKEFPIEIYTIQQEIAGVINAISKLPTAKRNSIVDAALKIKRLNSDNFGSIIRSLSKVPTDRLERIVNKINSESMQRISSKVLGKMVKAAIIIPTTEWDSLVQQADELRMALVKDSADAIPSIMDALYKIPVNERGEIIAHTVNLMADYGDVYSLTEILPAIYKVPAKERLNVVTLAKSIIPPRLYIEASFVTDILLKLSKVSIDKRQEYLDTLRFKFQEVSLEIKPDS